MNVPKPITVSLMVTLVTFLISRDLSTAGIVGATSLAGNYLIK